MFPGGDSGPDPEGASAKARARLSSRRLRGSGRDRGGPRWQLGWAQWRAAWASDEAPLFTALS